MIANNPLYEEYTQLNPVFIAVDPWTPHPLIFKMSDETLSKGKDGYKDHYDHVYPYLKKNNITGNFYVPTSIWNKNKILNMIVN